MRGEFLLVQRTVTVATESGSPLVGQSDGRDGGRLLAPRAAEATVLLALAFTAYGVLR